MNVEDFRRIGMKLIDWIAEYRDEDIIAASSRSWRAWRRNGQRDCRRRPDRAGAHGCRCSKDLNRVTLPACTHWQDPRFFGYFLPTARSRPCSGDYVTRVSRSSGSTGRRPALDGARGVPR